MMFVRLRLISRKQAMLYINSEKLNELGASELYKLFGVLGANVPLVRKEKAKDLYIKCINAHKDGLILSSHNLSDGGLSVTNESCIGTSLGVQIDLNGLQSDLDNTSLLYAESHSDLLFRLRQSTQGRLSQ